MDGAYDKSVDLWSIGVITYVMYVKSGCDGAHILITNLI